VGSGVSGFKAGDAVIISCITSCGRCSKCKKGIYSHCADGGWILGHLIDGTQAEYVRIPHADMSLHFMPPGVDQEALVMVSDILPTGYECGILNGRVEPGQTVAIVGAGPVGLAALLAAQFYSPAEIFVIDIDENRLATALRLGASSVVNNTDGKAVAAVMKMTGGRGVDTAIEVVGSPATFAVCEGIVAAGGTLANIGVHGEKVDLHIERLWSHNISITTRLVDTVTIPLLLKTIKFHKVEPKQLITHHFKIADMLEAYDTFARAAATKALKVIIEV
jgi:alcohol dehydrogenase